MPLADKNIIQDAARLDALRSLCLLDTPADPAFDRLTRLACHLLDVPISLVSLIDADRQFFKSQTGLPEPYANICETPLSHSFCQHTVATAEPLIIEDAREHPLVYDLIPDDEAAKDLNVIAYLGIPLVTSDGHALGSLCAIDQQPRTWSDDDIENLKDLAAAVMTEIELRSELKLHRHTRQVLQERERFISKALEAMPPGLQILDLPTRSIIYDNQRLQKLLGLPDDSQSIDYDELRGRLHPKDSWLLDEAQQVLHRLTPDNSRMFPCRLYHEDDSWHDFELTCTSFTQQDNHQPEQVILAWQDVTLHKQAESELFRQELEHRQSILLRDFIRSASHDLRTPLTVIQTKLELLRRTTSATRQNDYADNMQKQINHIERTLSEFNTLSELLGQDGLQPDSIRINNLVKAAAESIRREYPNRGHITIEYNLEPDMGSIQADPRQLQLAIGGLIENALVYNQENGHIKICTACDPVRDTVILEVHDTGKGIDEESLKHIFDPFYKVNEARTQGAGRAGLGLSIVKRVVDWHQGRIEVTSTPGEGSCFRVLLPAHSTC